MKRIILIGALASSAAFADEPLTYQEFMKKVNTAQQKIDYSETLIKRSELDALILEREKNARNQGGGGKAWLPDSFKNSDQDNQGGAESQQGKTESQATKDTAEAQKTSAVEDAKAPITPESSNHQGKPAKPDTKALGKEQQTGVAQKQVNKASQTARVTKTFNLPPGLVRASAAVKNEIYVDTPKKSILFGIPIGTRIPVELETGASNAQPGYIQFKVLKDIEGDKRVLPKGSTLFARGNSFPGTSRLHATVSKGITIEEHEEFSLRGIVFADDGQAGLIGEVVSDGRTLERATDAGIYALGEGIIDTVPGSELAAEAGKRAAKQALRENEQESSAENGRVRFIVEAGPQQAVLQIEETF